MREKIYKSGEQVEIGGTYMCLACGEMIDFAVGELLSDCPNCGAGTANAPSGFVEGVEFWVRVS